MRLFHTILAIALVATVGCDKEKSGVEKRAEEMAAEKASASAAAKASAAIPDPKEEQYAAKRKALKDRATGQLTALEKLYVNGTEADRTAYRAHFAPDKEGEKAADEESKEALAGAKLKMSIKKWELTDMNLDPTQTVGTVDTSVEENQNGKPRCVTYKTEWKEFDGTWRRVARKDFRIVPCT